MRMRTRTKNRASRIDVAVTSLERDPKNLFTHPAQHIEKINTQIGSLMLANRFPITVQSSALRKTTLFARF